MKEYMKIAESIRNELNQKFPELQLTNRISAQLSCYPGFGSEYKAHVDEFQNLQKSCRYEGRKITLLYYLNDGWEEGDGGTLRVYLGKDSKNILQIGEDAWMRENASRRNLFWDINPTLDNFVMFRSSDVVHGVMPCSTPRFAITIWLYGMYNVEQNSFDNFSENKEDTPISIQIVPKTSVDCLERDRIFVSIASYRDSECQHTLRDLFTKASRLIFF